MKKKSNMDLPMLRTIHCLGSQPVNTAHLVLGVWAAPVEL
jgi:hypothetical protein